MTYRVKIKDRNQFLAEVVHVEADSAWGAIKKVSKQKKNIIPVAVFVEVIK